jgi:hypothetical protein
MKPTITNQLGRGALLLALCIGLSGCVSNQIQTQGTITAVNASGQTIEIKTDAGQSQTVSVAANTVLYDGERLLRTKMTLDQIKAGNYLVVKQSPNPEGKLIADWGGVFNQRPTNLRGSGSVAPTAGLTAGPTSGATSVPTLGSSLKQGEKIPADKAVVYIYRPSGSTRPFLLRVNGKVAIPLKKGLYYAYVTEPGVIEFTAQSYGTSSMTLDVKAGQTYYLKGSVPPGFTPTPSMVLVSSEVGANEITNCKLIP